MKILITFAIALAFGVSAFAQSTKPAEQKEKPAISEAKTKADEQKAAKPTPPPAPTSPGEVYDRQLSTLERELVPAAEAMPDDKFDFKPNTPGGEFSESRTFKQQVGHVAINNFYFASMITGEKFEMRPELENGPPSLTDKASTIKYLKDSFAAAHKAVRMLDHQTMLQPGSGTRMPKMAAGNILLWHGFDHYGQMAIYLRMNGIVPPASRAQ
jgi:hypothetical protein